MTPGRAARLASVLLLVAAAVSACSAPPVHRTAPAPSAATTTFACPSAKQLAALTAIDFAARSVQHVSCGYAGMVDGDPAQVTIQHPAATQGALPTLAASRAAQPRTTDVQAAPKFSADAFLARAMDRSCTAYVYAVDGVVTAVTARRAGPEALHSCDLAASAAALMGTRARTAAPVVAVVAGAGLLPAGTVEQVDVALRERLGVQLDVTTAAVQGYTPVGAATMTTAARSVDPGAGVVVLVSGPVDAHADRLTVLHDATMSLAAAHARAPRARLVVVGPAGAGAAPTADVLALRDALRIAARIGDADFVDPIDAGWGSGAPTPVGGALTGAGASRLGRGVAARLTELLGHA